MSLFVANQDESPDRHRNCRRVFTDRCLKRSFRGGAAKSPPGSGAEVAKLLGETDTVAEIHGTLRAGVAVRLEAWGPHR
jgi:ethanolamine utilization microcompartment shell protein EutL